MTTDNDQIIKWMLPKPITNKEIYDCKVNYTLQKVLLRRGFNLKDDLDEYLTPSDLPNPEDHFTELKKATNRIIEACEKDEKIAICGDYDADGITSTVLLVELLTKIGADVTSYVPSRQDEGYGLNINIINDINDKEIKLIITVDNGISAHDAIKKANEFNIDLIITDHHKIPKNIPNIFALIHPDKSPRNSPYKYLAGVGLAYILALNLCNKLHYDIDNTSAKILFCIGTVADMAPLIGANRNWLKEYLPIIKNTNNIAIKTIIKKLAINDKEITSDDIGFKIAPLINAVGRIGDPKLVIDLLTNASEVTIKKLTKEFFDINKERKRITSLAEKDALKMANKEYSNNYKFITIVNNDWHPGIIGIVAARIVEKFNLPTAIISVAKDGSYRGSIRSTNNLKVNFALDECNDLLISHGGHSAAAGFTIRKENISKLKEKLNNIANREFVDCDLTKSINPDACLSLSDINLSFYDQLMLLAPFGIRNKAPIFWSRKIRILEVKYLKGNHLKMIISDGNSFINAIKWNNLSQIKVNDLIDIAYTIEINNWKKFKTLQLNIIDIKKYNKVIDLQLHKKNYKCQLTDDMKIKISNSQGECINSEIFQLSNKDNLPKSSYAKKILSFAEIALGKTA